MVTHAHRTISLSLPEELVEDLDAWSEADQRSRSAIVARLIEDEHRRRLETELEQAYKELTADGFYDEIETYLPAQAEIILAEPF